MSRIEVEIGVRNAAFRSGLEEVRASARKFTGDLKSMFAGAFAAGAILGGIRNLLSKAENITDLMDRFKVGAEAVQQLTHAATLSATSIESVARGLDKLRVAQMSATAESREAYKVFSEMGMNMEDIAGLPVEQLFYRVADAVSKATTETEQMHIATAIFGNQLSSELIPMLEQGGQQIRDLGESLPILSGHVVENLDLAAKEIKKFQETLTVAFGTLVSFVFMPVIRAIQSLAIIWGGYAYVMTETAREVAAAWKNIFTGNFSAAFDQARNLNRFLLQTYQTIITAQREVLKEIWQPPEMNTTLPVRTLPSTVTEEAARLEKQLLTEREKNEKARLDRQQRINLLQEEYNRLLAEANNLTGIRKTQKLIEAEKTRGELEREERGQSEVEEQEKKRLADEVQRHQKDLERARQREASVDESNLLAQIDESAKRSYLQQKQKHLYSEAESAAYMGNELLSVEKRTQAKELETEIRSATRSTDPDILTVASLQRVGGGGGIGTVIDSAQRERERQTQLLERIARALENQELRMPNTTATLAP